MPRPRKSRIYWKGGRAYADFRDFTLWGGRQEALVGPGARAATRNADEAMRLCAARLAELEEAKRLHPGLEKADLDFVNDRVWSRPNATRQNVNKVRGTAR